MGDFKIERARGATLIYKRKYDLRPKLPDSKSITTLLLLFENHKTVSLNKPCNLIGYCVLVELSHWLGKKLNLEHKKQ